MRVMVLEETPRIQNPVSPKQRSMSTLQMENAFIVVRRGILLRNVSTVMLKETTQSKLGSAAIGLEMEDATPQFVRTTVEEVSDIESYDAAAESGFNDKGDLSDMPDLQDVSDSETESSWDDSDVPDLQDVSDSEDENESTYETANETNETSDIDVDIGIEMDDITETAPDLSDFSEDLSRVALGDIYANDALAQLCSSQPYPGDNLLQDESTLVSGRFSVQQLNDGDFIISDFHHAWHSDFEDGIIVPGHIVLPLVLSSELGGKQRL
ncbi:hypothetical protein C8J56DRAFT_891530 [Mycena floridula]|nr:hypothetical protein C8J56DRAFT_891530 [Mycena floridula]